MSDVNIICMKWGTAYGPEYVNRLYGMVNRNLTHSFRFVCFTDDAAGIRQEVEIKPMPDLGLPQDTSDRNWNKWKKLATWDHTLADLTGRTLFLDVDIVIVDNIDCFVEYDAKFAIILDQLRPKRRVGNSSVYLYDIGKFPEIIDNFRRDPDYAEKNFSNEQHFLTVEMAKMGKLQFWPEEWCPSYKYRCVGSWPLSWFRTPIKPKGAKILIFHGDPNPSGAIAGKRTKPLRFIRPAPWLEEYWQE